MRYAFCGVGVLLAWCLVCGGAPAQEDSPSSSSLEFILRPVKEGFYCSLPSVSRTAEVSFKKEPAYSSGRVYRHAFKLGDGPADFIGAAYDEKEDVLYVDKNRNLDLTDDGPGYSDFNGVTIELIHGDIPVSYVLDIDIYGDYCDATVISGWKGDVEIGGKRCSMWVADNLNGVFNYGDRFVFDHERHREARLAFGKTDEVPLPRWVYFEGQIYRMDHAFRVVDGETALAVTMTPVTEGLMDIAFEGQAVSRILLQNEDDDYGMLDWPVPAMRIPDGVYTPTRIDVLDSFCGYPETGEKLKAGENILLKAGGPLNQEVAVARRGATLNMEYALKGLGDTPYNPDSEEDNAAEFAVYQNGRKIETGRFRYG